MYDFGISGTKRSVSNRGVRKERLDCSYLGIPEIMAYPKSGTGPCTLAWSLDSGLWILVPGLWTYSTSPHLPQRKKILWTLESPPPEIFTLRHLFKTYIIELHCVLSLIIIRTVYNEFQRKTSRHGYHR